jgi:rod shape-determining protein MreC
LGPLLRRYREAFFVLGCLALPLVLFLSNGRRPHAPNWMDKVVIWLTAPVEHALVVVVGGATDAFGNYVWLRGVRDENLAVKRELLRQRAELQLLFEAQAEVVRLRGLLDYAEKSPALRLLAARVVAVGASPHSHTLRIDRGTDSAVRPGLPVIAPEGVVGTVAQAIGGYADVQLIVSPLSAVSALSARTRGRSTVHGTGDLSRCRIDLALRSDDLQEGDWLLTAGGEGFFPKGLRIGRVTNVQRRSTGMFLGAEVVPTVPFGSLDEVFVVLDQGTEQRRPPAPGVPLPAPLPGAATSTRVESTQVRRPLGGAGQPPVRPSGTHP